MPVSAKGERVEATTELPVPPPSPNNLDTRIHIIAFLAAISSRVVSGIITTHSTMFFDLIK